MSVYIILKSGDQVKVNGKYPPPHLRALHASPNKSQFADNPLSFLSRALSFLFYFIILIFCDFYVVDALLRSLSFFLPFPTPLLGGGRAVCHPAPPPVASPAVAYFFRSPRRRCHPACTPGASDPASGAAARATDHVYCSPSWAVRDGTPYSVARIMEFLSPEGARTSADATDKRGATAAHIISTNKNNKTSNAHASSSTPATAAASHPTPTTAASSSASALALAVPGHPATATAAAAPQYTRVRLAWYYRPSDVSDRPVADARLLLAAIYSEICDVAQLRAKCFVVHRDKITDLAGWKRRPDRFYFNRLFDPYIKKEFEVIRSDDVRNREWCLLLAPLLFAVWVDGRMDGRRARDRGSGHRVLTFVCPRQCRQISGRSSPRATNTSSPRKKSCPTSPTPSANATPATNGVRRTSPVPVPSFSALPSPALPRPSSPRLASSRLIFPSPLPRPAPPAPNPSAATAAKASSTCPACSPRSSPSPRAATAGPARRARARTRRPSRGTTPARLRPRRSPSPTRPPRAAAGARARTARSRRRKRASR